MRLINTETYELQEFFDNDIPRYAILSHRWEEDEVSYVDFIEGRKEQRLGFKKIKNFCAVAHWNSYIWGWVDTCCIDKRSSAELSEAINSMFRWYENATICMAYLSDVTKLDEIEQSKWFTRCWTLQELLAPNDIVFYNRHWKFLQYRNRLAQQISSLTGIAFNALGGLYNYSLGPDQQVMDERRHAIQTESVAVKMSWASNRQASREEDVAYCLLGLFNVNMPLLYGEGKDRAFQRLQRENMTGSDDESIFAWMTQSPGSRRILADSPNSFRFSSSINELSSLDPGFEALVKRKPYQITNKGLRIEVHLLKWYSVADGADPTMYLIPINCKRTGSQGSSYPLLLNVRESGKVDQKSMRRLHRISEPDVPTEMEWNQILLCHDTGLKQSLEECPMEEVYLDIWGR